MKTRFLALAALVLGLASCQTEPEGLDVNVGGEVDTTITVSLPETTRAADSALGAFDNVDLSGDATIRYILKIYQKVGNEYVASNDRQVEYSDGKSVVFPVRLVPNRDYRFVVWADYVEGEADVDYHYNTADLTNIELMGEWKPMDETRDAFTGVYCTVEAGKQYTGTSSINILLKRPFAKLRVITTDMVELGYLGINPTHATVEYATPYRASFNALESVAVAAVDSNVKSHGVFEIAAYDADNTDANKVLFTDYFFAEQDVVKFTLSVYEDAAMTKPIKSNFFNTDISVNRNYLTTIKGNILTDGNNVKVDIIDAFAGETKWPEDNNSAEQLAYAAMFGGEVTLTADIDFTQPLTIVEGANVVLNLNGKTISGNWHKNDGAVIKNNGTLTIVGGTISSTGENGGSAIQNNGTLTVNGATLNGAPNANGSWPSYTVNNTGVMTLENTTITSYHGAVASYGDDAVVTLNKCTIDMTGIPGFTSHGIYTYNNGKVVVNGGTYENKATDQTASGASVINGAVEVNAGTFSGRIENYYGTPVLKGGIFSVKPNTNFIAAGYKVIEKNGKFVVVAEDVDAVATNGKELNDALANGDDVVMTEDVKVASNETGSNGYGATGISQTNGGTIDGNGNDISVNAWGTWDSAINTTGGTIKNINVTGGMRGIFVNHNSTNCSKVILENVTIDGTVYTISCDQGTNNGLEATNSTFNGWTSYAATLGDVKFTNCSFGEGQGYAYCRPYAPTEFVNCDFAVGYEIDAVAPVTFKNCTIGGVALTVENIDQLGSLTNKMLYHNDKFVSVAKTAITNKDGVRYEGDAFESGYMVNALWFNNYVFGGDAAIKVDGITYGAIVIENCSGEFKNDVITINNDNNSVMILQNLDFTIAEGKKLIKSTNKIHQVFMENITINGEKMTNESIAKYLENVEWYQVVEEI